MRYPSARSQIKDGDLIAVRRTDGLLARLTRYFTRSDYTHVGLALWLNGGLWMAEINGGGNHVVPLSQVKYDFDVYHPPVRDRMKLRASIFKRLRNKMPYGFGALALIGLLDWLRLAVTLRLRRSLVCSGWCVAAYEGAGWPRRSRAVSPRQLCAWLELKLTVNGKV